ncbi:cupin domain-containing protein [Aureibaculum sp. 2210JD6-5]|uniref:cupin domain-containing protein n=1 Tax=Aureibaculum sp. 2210JD6-5 TaxID=3103957 RepID=UPI002AAE8ACF|nr:cupin domain-containing protein [Aureibaculum sp. 2210JD6-5]MDY7393616.1 cupin domain-containing protein [Aureibaculum sp. 2210JD6-5]
MKTKFTFFILTSILLSGISASAQEIPIEHLNMKLQPNQQEYSKTILKNEIPGIKVDHVALTGKFVNEIQMEDGFKYIYLFMKGNGNVVANKERYDIVPETIFLPNSIQNISINVTKNDTLHFLKISSKLTEQDKLDLAAFPEENTLNVYYTKFEDTEAYTEPIKSPNTVSRTILPNKYIPRIAMGTVKAPGPDHVGAHEHGMLEQLFLGLAGNNIIVHADDAKVNLPEYSVLHIPLGSSHSVDVGEGDEMYYVWMDFFRDKAGEEWLKTHKKIEKE